MKSQITIKKIQDLLSKGLQNTYVDDDTSRRMWWASLEVVQKEFLSQNYYQGGIWVASPLPALNDKKFFSKLKGWLWSPEGFPYFKKENAGFLPVNHSTDLKEDLSFISNYKLLNLNSEDGYEPFLLIIKRVGLAQSIRKNPRHFFSFSHRLFENFLIVYSSK